MLGGVLVGIVDPGIVFLLNAACFAASAALVRSVHGRFSDHVTTESDEKHIQRALDAGAQGYVMKPFTADALSGKLAAIGVAAGSA